MKNDYNNGYTHEALHTVMIIIGLLREHVIDERCASEFEDVKVLAEKAEDVLGKLYQLIGTKSE